jgi:glycosyltransferase involved in cell wall biosynthesis
LRVKIAFIVQRYGKEILGGSETLARQLAERLSRRHEITVLTTTAKDYITWKNELPPGEDKARGIRLIRFPVEGERDLEEFNRFSEEIYKGHPTREQELEWLRRQGPVVPELVEYLKKEHETFDLLVFFTYLYYPTYHGLQVAPEKSVLVPTAHDEPPLKLGIYREMFQLPSSFLFNTEAEELLVLERFPVHKKMRETVGMGMELLDQPDVHAFRNKHAIPGKYLLYAGRIDAGKGLEELFRYFQFYKEEHPGSGNLQLILIGKLGMKLPDDPAIRYIGFVDEGDKLSAMAGAVAVVQPSRLESFSIVTLEAFSVGTPVIANAQSRVLADHCRKANAGLYYGDFEEFEEVLTLLLNDRNLGRSLGRNGQTYVKDNYGWNRLLPKYELVFRSSARPAREPKGARARPAAVSATPHEPEHDHEPEDLVSTGDLPLLEPGPEEEPLEARPEELDTALEDGSYSGESDTSEPEELAELAPEESGYEEEETALELAPEERQPPADARDSYRAPEPPDEEPYHEPAEEIREAAPQESPAADEGGLPAFYRPRLRPTSTPKGAPEPTKED